RSASTGPSGWRPAEPERRRKRERVLGTRSLAGKGGRGLAEAVQGGGDHGHRDEAARQPEGALDGSLGPGQAAPALKPGEALAAAQNGYPSRLDNNSDRVLSPSQHVKSRCHLLSPGTKLLTASTLPQKSDSPTSRWRRVRGVSPPTRLAATASICHW